MPSQPLALYIHWPFCLKKCPYCDFNSHLRRADQKQHTYVKALLDELTLHASKLGKRHLTSIFFGGGTPSLLQPQEIAQLIKKACTFFPPKKPIEITLEANPSSLETDKLPDFKQAGINRVSIGVQSFDNDALRFLGRQHSAQQAIRALDEAYKVFDRVNFDLIYGLPEQTLEQWDKQLERALSFSPTHLSAYQLTIEPDTPFETLYRKKSFSLPSQDVAAELYKHTEDKLAKGGLFAYEISNYAAPDAQSQHNLSYWHYKDYLGIGAGAHSRLTQCNERIGQENIKSPVWWQQATQKDQLPIAQRTKIAPKTAAIEMFLMNLRLSEGINFKEFYSRTAVELSEILDGEMVRYCIKEGFLVKTDTHLAPTFSGRLRLEALLGTIVQ